VPNPEIQKPEQVAQREPLKPRVGSREWTSRETGKSLQELEGFYDYIEHLTSEVSIQEKDAK